MGWLFGCFRRKKKRNFPLNSKKPEFPSFQADFTRSNAFSNSKAWNSSCHEGRDDRVTVRQVLNDSSACSLQGNGDELRSLRSQVVSTTSARLSEKNGFSTQVDEKSKQKVSSCKTPTSPWSQVDELEREFDKLRRNLRRESVYAKTLMEEVKHSDVPPTSIEDSSDNASTRSKHTSPKENCERLQNLDLPACVSLHNKASSSTEQTGQQNFRNGNGEGSGVQQNFIEPASSKGDIARQKEVEDSRNILSLSAHLECLDESNSKMDGECILLDKPDGASAIEKLKTQGRQASEEVSCMHTTHESEPHDSRFFSQNNQYGLQEEMSGNEFVSFQSKISTTDSVASLSCAYTTAEYLAEGSLSDRSHSESRLGTTSETTIFTDCHGSTREFGDAEAETPCLCSSPPFSPGSGNQKLGNSTSSLLYTRLMCSKFQQQHHDHNSAHIKKLDEDDSLSDVTSNLSVEGRYSHGCSNSAESISMDFSNTTRLSLRNANLDETALDGCMHKNVTENEKMRLTNKNVRLRKHLMPSVLTPVENFEQWKQLIENSGSEKENPEECTSGRKRQTGVARPLHLSVKDFEENQNYLENVISVDASLSHWLRPLPSGEEINQGGTLATISEEDASKVVQIGTPSSTTANSSQFSSKQYESLSPKSPDDRPILGIVAAHWSDTLSPPKWWDGKGIPNSTNKYKEDQKVNWHTTPFEERLERALANQELPFQK